MGKIIDRVTRCLLLFGAALMYFQWTIRILWISVLFSIALVLLILKMTGKPERLRIKRPRFTMIQRKTAPRCAVYGAIYLALYLALGKTVYLLLSLVLIFIAIMGFRKKEPDFS